MAENEYKFKVKEKSGENKCFDAILKLETEDDCFIRFFNSFINGMKAKLLPVQIKEESCTRKKEEKVEERAACGRTVSVVKTDALAVVALLMAFLEESSDSYRVLSAENIMRIKMKQHREICVILPF